VKIALYRKEITGVRGILFGIREAYQKLGASILCWDYAYHKWRKRDISTANWDGIWKITVASTSSTWKQAAR